MATLGASDQDRGEVFEKSIEVTASESEMVHSKGGRAFSGAELNRPRKSSILSELVIFYLTYRVIGTFRWVR